MMTAVSTKLTTANSPVVPSDLPSTLRFSVVPPSNRITTRAMVAINEPILPKSSGLTMPSTGPITMPTSISTSTSGILVLQNCIDRKCAKNTIMPMIKMVVDIFATRCRTGANYTCRSLQPSCTSEWHLWICTLGNLPVMEMSKINEHRLRGLLSFAKVKRLLVDVA